MRWDFFLVANSKNKDFCDLLIFVIRCLTGGKRLRLRRHVSFVAVSRGNRQERRRRIDSP
jgi:hypothetical protein